MRARRSGSEPRTASRVEAGAHPVEESAVGRGDLLTAQLGEPAEKLLLLGTQLRRDLDVDADEQVAASAAAQRGHALALDPLDPARLRAGRHHDLSSSPSSVRIGKRAPSAAWVRLTVRTC